MVVHCLHTIQQAVLCVRTPISEILHTCVMYTTHHWVLSFASSSLKHVKPSAQSLSVYTSISV